MKEHPLVSIIIPSFNQGKFIRETLDSVFAQDYPRIEVIVIDGGSTDQSVGIIRKYTDRLAHWESEKDRGQSHAINKGYAKCNGEIVNWLCSDDVLLPGAVSEVVRVFQEKPGAGAVLGDVYFTDEDSKVTGTYKGTYTAYDDLIRFWNGRVIIPQPACFLNRRLVDSCPFFLDETYHHAMDYDFWCRTFDGEKVALANRPLATYRQHAAAKTTASDLWRTDKLAISSRYWGPWWSARHWDYRLSSYRVHRRVYAAKAWDLAHRARLRGQRAEGFAALARAVWWRPELTATKNFWSMCLSIGLGFDCFEKLKARISGRVAGKSNP